MKLLGIGYDLRVPGQHYPALTKTLNALGAKRVLQSFWVVKSDHSTADLRDYLRRFIDNSDRMFVEEIGHWASFNTMATPKDL